MGKGRQRRDKTRKPAQDASCGTGGSHRDGSWWSFRLPGPEKHPSPIHWLMEAGARRACCGLRPVLRALDTGEKTGPGPTPGMKGPRFSFRLRCDLGKIASLLGALHAATNNTLHFWNAFNFIKSASQNALREASETGFTASLI